MPDPYRPLFKETDLITKYELNECELREAILAWLEAEGIYLHDDNNLIEVTVQAPLNVPSSALVRFEVK